MAVPRQAERLVDANGFISPSWWKYLNNTPSSAQLNELSATVSEILGRLTALEAARNLSIIGRLSVVVRGSPSTGSVGLSLVGDAKDPGNTYYYGTGPTGNKGWSAIASAFTATATDIDLDTGSDGVTNIQLADLADSGGGTLVRIDRDDKGRVAGTSTPTTDDLAEGVTNLYYTDARVISLMGDPDTDLLAIYIAARDAP